MFGPFYFGGQAYFESFGSEVLDGLVRLSSWLSMFNEPEFELEAAGGGAALAEAHS